VTGTTGLKKTFRGKTGNLYRGVSASEYASVLEKHLLPGGKALFGNLQAFTF